MRTAASYDADILILSLEREEETCAAIASALAQRGISRRVIVVDQGSRPETIARLRASVGDNPDVSFICLWENLGVAGGRNRAATAGRGRVLIGLDNDAEFDGPDCAARAVAALDASPDLAAVGLRILRHADGGDDLSSWGYPLPLLARAGESFDTVTFVGAGHAIWRAAWEEVGGYDPALFFCWEEFDFCLRAIVFGWRVRSRSDIAVRHKVSAEARQEQWPAEKVGIAVLARHPCLHSPARVVPAGLAHLGTARRLLTHYLMGIEARALTRAMLSLQRRGVLALPLHDSLIVPERATEEAREAIREGYRREAGVEVVVRS